MKDDLAQPSLPLEPETVSGPEALGSSGLAEDLRLESSESQNDCKARRKEMVDTRSKQLAELAAQAANCRRCSLRNTCRQVVFGEGGIETGIVLIGEAPGATEDQLGRPFVGAAGQLLNKILAAVGFARSDVYITNVNKCRPPGNRVPTEEEEGLCRPWLESQLEIISPVIVVALGSHASRALIDKGLRITRERGRWVERDGYRILPTFHPAALLRDPSKKKPVWEDFQAVRAYYDSLV